MINTTLFSKSEPQNERLLMTQNAESLIGRDLASGPSAPLTIYRVALDHDSEQTARLPVLILARNELLASAIGGFCGLG